MWDIYVNVLFFVNNQNEDYDIAVTYLSIMIQKYLKLWLIFMWMSYVNVLNCWCKLIHTKLWLIFKVWFGISFVIKKCTWIYMWFKVYGYIVYAISYMMV